MKLEWVPETPKNIIPLSKVKEWLKVDNDAEDAIINRLIQTAGVFLENALNRTILSKKRRFIFESLPEQREIILPFDTVLSGESLLFFEKDGSERVYEGIFETYIKIIDGFPAKLLFSEKMIPMTQGVKSFSFELSFGEKIIPKPLEQAAFLLVAWWFENRGDESAFQTRSNESPAGLERLIAPYRIRRLR